MATEIPFHEATVRWPDPSAALAATAALDGLAYVEAVRDGTLPIDPFGALLGLAVTAAERGAVTLSATVGGGHTNLGGIAHGGFLSTVMDLACGLSVHSTLGVGRSCPHVQSSYRFLRAGAPGQTLVCAGEVVHTGRTLAVARCSLTDADGRLLATGESTHAYLDIGGARA